MHIQCANGDASLHEAVSSYFSARVAQISEVICPFPTHRDQPIVRNMDRQNVGRSDWIVAVCSVLFDLDVGQQMESVYPIAAISETTATSVAFHSFPVSTQDDRQFGCETDHTTPSRLLQVTVVRIFTIWSSVESH